MIAMLAAATLQAAETPPPVLSSDVIVDSVVWEVRPAVGYPRIASSQGIASGWALVRCQVDDRQPRECQVLQESTPGVGFGQQAVEGLQSGRLRKDWAGGHDGLDRFNQLVRFQLAD